MPDRPYLVRACLTFFATLSACCVLIIALPVHANDGKAVVAPVTRSSAFFGGKDIELTFDVRGSEKPGRAAWSAMIGPRSINGGTLMSEAKNPGRFIVKLRTPAVKEGTVLKMVLTVTANSEKDEPIGSCVKELWIFPSDPFVNRSKWLDSLAITLFDPAETTGPILKNSGIPFKETANVVELAGKPKGLVLIGAGISFDDYPELWTTLINLARRGVPVLCLAPAAGELSLPVGEGGTQPDGITVHRTSIIRRLDKRLDTTGWPPGDKVAIGGINLKGDERQIMATASKGGAWPWLEIDYAAPGGKLVICSFDLMNKAKWDAGPTPRFLFARLLEYVTEKNEPPSTEERNEQK